MLIKIKNFIKYFVICEKYINNYNFISKYKFNFIIFDEKKLKNIMLQYLKNLIEFFEWENSLNLFFDKNILNLYNKKKLKFKKYNNYIILNKARIEVLIDYIGMLDYKIIKIELEIVNLVELDKKKNKKKVLKLQKKVNSLKKYIKKEQEKLFKKQEKFNKMFKKYEKYKNKLENYEKNNIKIENLKILKKEFRKLFILFLQGKVTEELYKNFNNKQTFENIIINWNFLNSIIKQVYILKKYNCFNLLIFSEYMKLLWEKNKFPSLFINKRYTNLWDKDNNLTIYGLFYKFYINQLYLYLMNNL